MCTREAASRAGVAVSTVRARCARAHYGDDQRRVGKTWEVKAGLMF